MTRLFAGILILATSFLAGCTEESMQTASFAGGGAQKTAQEKELEKQARSLNQVSKDIIVRNTVEGALIGAAAGCGIAVLMGGDGNDCLVGAAVGGVAGGVGGNAVGRQAAEKNEEIVKTAEVVKNLGQVSSRLNGVETNLRAVLKSQDAEIRSLRRQVQSSQISQSQYQTRVKAINSNRRVVSNELRRSEANVVQASQQLDQASSQGQTGLGTAKKAAASNQNRLKRTLATIKQVDL
ncbi:MAG: hypothetical protein AAFQ47_09655 [Pseudomonadota bacterium]